MRRIVITGLGVVSPAGNGRDAFWANLLEGRSGIGPITLFDVSTFPVRIGGQVRLDDMQQRVARIPELGQERDRKVRWPDRRRGGPPVPISVPGTLNQASLHVGGELEVFFLQDLTGAAHSPDMQTVLARNALAAGSRLLPADAAGSAGGADR